MKILLFGLAAFAVSALVAAQVYHNYALVCFDDREITDICSSLRYQYYCTSEGSVMRRGGHGNTDCDAGCRCVNLNPRRNHLAALIGKIYCDFAKPNIEHSLIDAQLQLSTGQHVGSVSGDILPLLPTSESNNIEHRDTGSIQVACKYAPTCDSTRDLTIAYQGGPYRYYYNSAGDVGKLGQQRIVREQSYGYINLYAKQPNILNPTWNLTRTIPKRNLASIKQNKLPAAGAHKLALELSITDLLNSLHPLTKTKAIKPLIIRLPATLSHNYALVCYNDQQITRACQDHKYGYYCTSSGTVERIGEADSVCDEGCKCQNLYPK